MLLSRHSHLSLLVPGGERVLRRQPRRARFVHPRFPTTSDSLLLVLGCVMAQSTISFDSLPVELVAEILGALDLKSLVVVSCLSRRLRQITSDPALNPWRSPILRILRSEGSVYEDCLRNLSVLTTVPRNNWIEIFSIARAEYLLFQASHPVLSETDWHECFRRRFLPDWARWKGEGRWKEVFLK